MLIYDLSPYLLHLQSNEKVAVDFTPRDSIHHETEKTKGKEDAWHSSSTRLGWNQLLKGMEDEQVIFGMHKIQHIQNHPPIMGLSENQVPQNSMVHHFPY